MQIDFSDYTTGAAVATALANTSPAVRVRSGETIRDTGTLARFLTEHGAEPARPVTPHDVEQVHALREEVREALAATTEREAAERGNALVARAGRGPFLMPAAGGRRWRVGTARDAGVAGELAVLAGTGLLGALHTLGFDRFRDCAAPECSGVFVDTSRAGRRRYCTPQICGNRLNVAQHRARRRTAPRDQPAS